MTKVDREENTSFKLEVEKFKYEAFCNKCGMSCRSMAGDFNGLIEARVQGGFYSTHLDDCDIYIFSLCERCLKELFETFKFDAYKGNLSDLNGYHAEELNKEFEQLEQEGQEALDFLKKEDSAGREYINHTCQKLGEAYVLLQNYSNNLISIKDNK